MAAMGYSRGLPCVLAQLSDLSPPPPHHWLFPGPSHLHFSGIKDSDDLVCSQVCQDLFSRALEPEETKMACRVAGCTFACGPQLLPSSDSLPIIAKKAPSAQCGLCPSVSEEPQAVSSSAFRK